MAGAQAAKTDVIITARTNVVQATKELNKLQRKLSKMSRGGPVIFTQVAKQQQKVADSTNKLNAALGQSPFQGWAMSIMFAGMALRRFFNTTVQFGVSAFQDIMHSTDGTVTSFDMLAGSTKYLGFAMGQAFEPIAAWLAPIILAIADWVVNNQTLAAWILIIVGVLGTLLMFLGASVLAFVGLKDGMAKVRSLKFANNIAAWIKNLKIFNKKAAVSFTRVLAIVGIIAAWIAAIGIAIGFFYLVKDSWDNVAEAFRLKVQLMGIEFGMFIAQAQKGWENLKFIALLIWNYIKLGVVEAINLILKKFESMVNKVRGWLNTIIGIMRWLGISINKLPEFKAPRLDTSKIRSDINKLQGDWINSYNEIEKVQRQLEKAHTENVNAQIANSQEAYAEIQDNWQRLLQKFDSFTTNFKAQGGDTATGITTDDVVSDPASSPTETKIYYNNFAIEGRRDDDSDEDYINRILSKIQQVM